MLLCTTVGVGSFAVAQSRERALPSYTTPTNKLVHSSSKQIHISLAKSHTFTTFGTKMQQFCNQLAVPICELTMSTRVQCKERFWLRSAVQNTVVSVRGASANPHAYSALTTETLYEVTGMSNVRSVQCLRLKFYGVGSH